MERNAACDGRVLDEDTNPKLDGSNDIRQRSRIQEAYRECDMIAWCESKLDVSQIRMFG